MVFTVHVNLHVSMSLLMRIWYIIYYSQISHFEDLRTRGLFRIISTSNYVQGRHKDKYSPPPKKKIILLSFFNKTKFWAHLGNLSKRRFLYVPNTFGIIDSY